MNEPFQVRIIKRAEKQLNKKMKFQRKEAIKEIKKLARNPYLGEKKKGEKEKIFVLKFIIKGVDYRCEYRFDKKDKVVMILVVGKRENFYNKRKRSH